MQNLYIIKLGGSVITTKEENRFEARKEAIVRLGKEIRKAMDKEHFQIVVVHGAGPFGHSNVNEYGINYGVFTERHKEGYKKTVKDCNGLDKVVVAQLKKNGLKPVAFDPNKIIVQESKRIVEFETAGIEKALSEGNVPVLYGQMVPDKKLNASVVSGDTILAFLAKKLGAKKVFLGTDVAGIFNADPKKDPNAKRIPLIDKDNFGIVFDRVSGANTVDVTQGMRGKLMKLKERLHGTTAFIFDANKEGNVYKALTGERIEGTEVRL